MIPFSLRDIRVSRLAAWWRCIDDDDAGLYVCLFFFFSDGPRRDETRFPSPSPRVVCLSGGAADDNFSSVWTLNREKEREREIGL